MEIRDLFESWYDGNLKREIVQEFYMEDKYVDPKTDLAYEYFLNGYCAAKEIQNEERRRRDQEEMKNKKYGCGSPYGDY